MRSKILMVVLVVILALSLVGCDNPVTPKELSASFNITKWEQSYWEYSGEWSNYVYVYYSIENTGNVEIDYYRVYFEATCSDGSKFEEWTNGMFIDVGHTENDYTMLLVLGKQVVSVKVSEYELENWDW